MRAGAAARLTFVPIVPSTSMPLVEQAAMPARSASSIELELAGAVLRIAPGTDGDLLATLLRAIRASAA